MALIEDRKRIEDWFHIKNGIIQTSGKFEAEPLYAPIVHNMVLDGCADEDMYDDDSDSITSYVVIDEEFQEVFKDVLKPGTHAIEYHEDTHGFAYLRELDQNAYEQMLNRRTEDRGPDQEAGDVTTEDYRNFYQYGKKVLSITEDHDMWTELDRWCEKEQFWPNFWMISDHGNAHLMTRENGKA